MVFVSVVVLKVVGTMMFLIPSFDHYSLISFGCRLEDFLDSWCSLVVHEEMNKRILILRGRKFPQMKVRMKWKNQTVTADHW